MTAYILGEKSETEQIFTEKGERIPVTFISTKPCYLVSIRPPNDQGYFSVKLGFGHTKNINKPVQGELTKAGITTPLRFLREFKVPDQTNIKIIEENKKKGIQIEDKKIYVGDELKPEFFFKVGNFVDISGISKGKGFQGVVKRHHFAGGPRTHGQSDRERAPGSIGQTTTPGRVYRGKRMAGRMGNERVTVKKLCVVEIKSEGIRVKGLVPGSKGRLVELRAL